MRRMAQTRNPAMDPWHWIPALRFAAAGMTHFPFPVYPVLPVVSGTEDTPSPDPGRQPASRRHNGKRKGREGSRSIEGALSFRAEPCGAWRRPGIQRWIRGTGFRAAASRHSAPPGMTVVSGLEGNPSCHSPLTRRTAVRGRRLTHAGPEAGGPDDGAASQP